MTVPHDFRLIPCIIFSVLSIVVAVGENSEETGKTDLTSLLASILFALLAIAWRPK